MRLHRSADPDGSARTCYAFPIPRSILFKQLNKFCVGAQRNNFARRLGAGPGGDCYLGQVHGLPDADYGGHTRSGGRLPYEEFLGWIMSTLDWAIDPNKMKTMATETRSTAKRRGKTREGGKPDGATRDILLKTTSDLMIEKGVNNVSLNDIGARSGLNPALVGYYFGNKAGLMVDLLRMVLGPGVRQMQALPLMDATPQEKLRIHVSGMVNVYFRFPYVNRLMHHLLMEDAPYFGPKIATEFSKPVGEVQRAILEDGFKKGIFRKVDPMMFYVQVIGACDQLFHGRYQLEYVFGVKGIDEELKKRFIDHLMDGLLNGILARPSGNNGGDPASAASPTLPASIVQARDPQL